MLLAPLHGTNTANYQLHHRLVLQVQVHATQLLKVVSVVCFDISRHFSVSREKKKKWVFFVFFLR